MTITLPLTAAQAQALERRALEKGLDLSTYLLHLAERDLRDHNWEETLDELTHLLPEDTPPLPDEAMQRSSYYEG